MSDRATFDREVITAAVAAAPIFQANGWEYSRTNSDRHVPDAFELMCTVQRLVDQLRTEPVDLDPDGSGEHWTRSGRWTVARTITGYTDDTADDEITIMLELAEMSEESAR